MRMYDIIAGSYGIVLFPHVQTATNYAESLMQLGSRTETNTNFLFIRCENFLLSIQSFAAFW